MDAEFWHQRWARGEIGFHQKEISTHLRSFWPSDVLPPGGQVFVPLCGKSLDMLWLRAEGYKVIGIEISAVAVEAFFRESNLEPTRNQQGEFVRWEVDGLVILQGDFFHLGTEELAGVSAVYDRASLVALPREMRSAYARHLEEVLPAGATTLLVTLDYPQDEMQGPPFSVDEQEVRALYGERHEIVNCYELDVLEENPRFRERGLSRMVERVFRLSHR
ncbi:MAG: thiopurine S-methyltransferase [Sedimenticola sp.]